MHSLSDAVTAALSAFMPLETPLSETSVSSPPSPLRRLQQRAYDAIQTHFPALPFTTATPPRSAADTPSPVFHSSTRYGSAHVFGFARIFT
jgi:hypothetical protein